MDDSLQSFVTVYFDYQSSLTPSIAKSPISFSAIDSLQVNHKQDLMPPMVTLCIDEGRKGKVRPGDILGALTGESGIAGDQVGKIDIFDRQAYVAIERTMVDYALKQLSMGKIKGRYFKTS